MKDWFVIDLGDALLAGTSLAALEARLADIHKAIGNRREYRRL